MTAEVVVARGFWVLLVLAACSGDKGGPDTETGADTDTDTDTETDTDTVGEVDQDGDGFAADADCDDAVAAVFPGADEHCDGVDEDCDGVADDEPVDGVEGFVDRDGDGFGVAAVEPCDTETPYAAAGGDCADDDPSVHPGAAERCNGVDDDCDVATLETAEIAGLAFPSIGAALSAAVDGDVIEVCDGTFLEHDLVVTSDVTVTSSSGDRDAAVIDGEQAGSVFVVQGGSLVLRSLTIRNGRGDRGGAVAADANPLVVEDCVLADNENPEYFSGGGAILATDLTVTDSLFTGNRASFGGAVKIEIDGALVATRTTFDANEATSNGGAVSAFRAEPVSFDSCTFTYNSGDGGGALDVPDVSVVDSTFLGNSGGWAGGAIMATSVVVTGGSFEANFTDPTVFDSSGGAIYVFHSLTADGTSFVGNSAVQGGAIRLWSTVGGLLLQLSNTSFEDNSGESGGAVFLVGASAEVDAATTFVGNVAPDDGWGGYGGAVYASLGADETWTGGTFLENAADDLGGALYSAGAGTFTGIHAEGNTAYSGGGLYFNNPPVLATDCTVIGNWATSAGGGVSANDLYSTGEGAVRMERLEIRQNEAPKGGGGDVYLTALEMVDCVVEENVATESGGGLYVWSNSSLTVQTSDFGVDALDNSPDDVWATTPYTNLGADVSFVCASGCSPL